jgi:hypothetical protein
LVCANVGRVAIRAVNSANVTVRAPGRRLILMSDLSTIRPRLSRGGHLTAVNLYAG